MERVINHRDASRDTVIDYAEGRYQIWYEHTRTEQSGASRMAYVHVLTVSGTKQM